ncbi:MAG: hypothetical protein JST00_07075 [Deltaproteobacteria bacterium]|nr:hypothetical protein [Deltaproteobacteria bacterium]
MTTMIVGGGAAALAAPSGRDTDAGASTGAPNDRPQPHHGALVADGRDRSPRPFAHALPVDLGNFCAESVGWGVVYTAGELLLAGAMMGLGGAHMCSDRSDCSEWSSRETTAMAALVGGYVAVKIVAAVHASAARELGAPTPSWSVGAAPVPGGGGAGGVVLRF